MVTVVKTRARPAGMWLLSQSVNMTKNRIEYTQHSSQKVKHGRNAAGRYTKDCMG